MKVQEKHGKVTQNMHGASINYRYIWDVSTAEPPRPPLASSARHASPESPRVFSPAPPLALASPLSRSRCARSSVSPPWVRRRGHRDPLAAPACPEGLRPSSP